MKILKVAYISNEREITLSGQFAEEFLLRFGEMVREEAKKAARKSIEEHNHDLDMEHDMNEVSLSALLEKMEVKHG